MTSISAVSIFHIELPPSVMGSGQWLSAALLMALCRGRGVATRRRSTKTSARTSSLPTLDGNVDDESRSCYDGERTGTSTATTRAVLACGDSELSGNARSELMLRATR